MKKTFYITFLMIITLFITFSLALSSFAADDETEPKLYISSNNLSYSDSLYLAYAIGADNIDITSCEVKMLFWNSPARVYEKGTEDYTSTAILQEVKNVMTPVVFSDGIAPKDIPDAIYARAYVEIGGETIYSDVVKYSPLQYLYERLNARSVSDDQRQLYESLLKYGALVQKVLQHDTEHLADGDFYNISVVGGSLSDGCAHGLYAEGDIIYLSCTVPENQIFAYWKDSSGNKVGYTNTLEIEVPPKDEQYEPVFADAEFTVIFKDCDGTELDVQTVANGSAAIPPVLPARDCIEYSWDKAFDNVTEDMEISAVYTEKHQFADIRCAVCGKYKETDINSFDTVDNGDSYTLVLKSDTIYEIIVIPETYKGKPITAVIPKTTDGPAYLNTLTTVVVSKNLETIGVGAFSYCSVLTEVIIPNDSSLKTIESNAFALSAITEIKLTEGLTAINTSAFNSCEGLKSIVLPSSLTRLGKLVFGGCSSLTEIKFVDPDNWYDTSDPNTPVSFDDPATNATNLKGSLKSKFFEKK